MIEIEGSRYESYLTAPNEGRVQSAPTRGLGRVKSWSKRRQLAWAQQQVLFRLPLVITDIVAASTILILVSSLFGMMGLHTTASSQLSLLGLQALLLFTTFSTKRLYRSVGMHPVAELERVVTATAITYLTLIAIVTWSAHREIANELACLVVSGGLCCFFLPSIRHLARCWLGKTRWWPQPMVAIGNSDGIEAFIREIATEKHLGWRPIGFVNEDSQSWGRSSKSSLHLGDEDDLPDIVEKSNVFWGLIDSRSMLSSETQFVLDRYHHLVPNLVSVVGGKGRTGFSLDIDCGGRAGICYESSIALLIPRMIKRCLDALVSGTALILLSPLFAAIALAIRFGSRGPIFYSQQRIGLNGSNFRIWKFRSMVPNADKVLQDCLAANEDLREEWKQTQKLTRDPRITRVGRLLRKTSLDELPQLWNVFNGTMSLVGPRPIVRSEIEKYGNVYWLYQRTKPGITGLWQVSGRNLTSYNVRLEYDSFYVRNWSVWLDWYILLKTFRVVVLCEGAY